MHSGITETSTNQRTNSFSFTFIITHGALRSCARVCVCGLPIWMKCAPHSHAHAPQHNVLTWSIWLTAKVVPLDVTLALCMSNEKLLLAVVSVLAATYYVPNHPTELFNAHEKEEEEEKTKSDIEWSGRRTRSDALQWRVFIYHIQLLHVGGSRISCLYECTALVENRAHNHAKREHVTQYAATRRHLNFRRYERKGKGERERETIKDRVINV